MAVHTRLKNAFTEDEYCHNLMRWLFNGKSEENINTKLQMLSTTKIQTGFFCCLRMRSWSAPLLFVYGKSRFSHDVALIQQIHMNITWNLHHFETVMFGSHFTIFEYVLSAQLIPLIQKQLNV